MVRSTCVRDQVAGHGMYLWNRWVASTRPKGHMGGLDSGRSDEVRSDPSQSRPSLVLDWTGLDSDWTGLRSLARVRSSPGGGPGRRGSAGTRMVRDVAPRSGRVTTPGATPGHRTAPPRLGSRRIGEAGPESGLDGRPGTSAGRGRWPGTGHGHHLRMPSRLITSRYFFRSCSRRYFSKLDRLETIISNPRRLAWSLACVLKCSVRSLIRAVSKATCTSGDPVSCPPRAKLPMSSCFFSFVIAISRPNATGLLSEAESV